MGDVVAPEGLGVEVGVVGTGDGDLGDDADDLVGDGVLSCSSSE